ncbi:MAG: amino acid ABC transporter permease [Pseudomonadota bacterium]
MAVTTEHIAAHASRPLPLVQRVTSSTAFAIGLYLLVMGALIYGAYAGAARMGYNWQWYNIPRYIWTYTEDGFQLGELIIGLGMTFVLSISSFLLAVLIGLVMALARLSDLVIGKALSLALLEFLRNMPLLVLVYLFYYVLGPIFGWDRVTSAILCLGVFHGALLSEIFRAGILSVAQGQWEGAKSIGMTKTQSYRYIILPQSVPLMLPPLTGEAVQLVKSSAIVSVIAVAELTTVGRNLISETYMSFEIWFTVAVIYLVITLLMSFGVTALEKRVAHD